MLNNHQFTGDDFFGDEFPTRANLTMPKRPLGPFPGEQAIKHKCIALLGDPTFNSPFTAREHPSSETDCIAGRFTVTGTHQGAFRGIEATNRRVTISEFTFYRIKDGKFAKVWGHADMDALMRQIGQGEAPLKSP